MSRPAMLLATTLTFAVLAAVLQPRHAAAQPEAITGAVTHGGEPAAGAQVAIVRYTVDGAQTRIERPRLDAPASGLIAYTDASGVYSLPWPAGAEWVLIAARGEGRFNTAQLREPGAANLALSGRHERQYEPVDWRARIIDADGNPQEGVRLEIVAVNSSFGEHTIIPWPEDFSAVSDVAGELGMTLPGYFGSATLRLSDERGQMTDQLSISPGGPHEIKYYPREPVIVDGTVVDQERNPVEGATVRVYGDPGEPGICTTDAEGHFELQFPDIAWRNILAWKDGVGFDATILHTGLKHRGGRSDDSVQGRNVMLTLLPRGAIFGTITDEETGAAIAGVQISANPSYVYEARTGTPGPIPHMELHRISEIRGRSATTDEQGGYRLVTDAGPALIHLTAPGYLQTGSLRGMQTMIPAGDEREQNFAMKRLYPLYMRVWHRGERITGYHIRLTSEQKARTHQWERPENADWDTMVATEEPGITFALEPVNVGNGEYVCEPATATVTEEPQTIEVHIREVTQ